MNKIIIFSRYIGFNVGGAEKSVLSYALKTTGNVIGLISLHNKKKIPISNSKLFYHKIIRTKFNFNRFFLVEYFLNKNKIKKYLNSLNIDYIIAYGINYPVLSSLTKDIKYEIQIRSEFDLAVFSNYYSGYKYFFKFVYSILEYPFYYFYRTELSAALIGAEQIVTPSHYLKGLLFNKFKVDAKVIVPEIEINVDDFLSTREYIVFVGDERIKGTHIIKYLAKSLPKQKFKIFTRKINKTYISKNITYMPWQDSVYNIFNTAKLILIPSQCGEGYSRISKESTLLGIPALGSNHGGIPEALDFHEGKLVNDYKSKKAWLVALNKKLSVLK